MTLIKWSEHVCEYKAADRRIQSPTERRFLRRANVVKTRGSDA